MAFNRVPRYGSNIGSKISYRGETHRYTKRNKDKGHDEPKYSSFFFIGSRIGWVSVLFLYYHIISRQASYRLTRQETRFCFLIIRPTLMRTKNLHENGPNPFFFASFNLMGTRMIQIRIAKSVGAFRNKTTNGFGAQIRLHQRYKTANGFRTRRNYYYICPITLLELK